MIISYNSNPIFKKTVMLVSRPYEWIQVRFRSQCQSWEFSDKNWLGSWEVWHIDIWFKVSLRLRFRYWLIDSLHKFLMSVGRLLSLETDISNNYCTLKHISKSLRYLVWSYNLTGLASSSTLCFHFQKLPTLILMQNIQFIRILQEWIF